MSELVLRAGPRFQRSYRRSSIDLQRLAEMAVREFAERFKALPKLFVRDYDRVEAAKRVPAGVSVVEIPLAGGPRLVLGWRPPTATLLDMGDHEIVPELRRANIAAEYGKASDPPPGFASANLADFFKRNPTTTVTDYGNELNPAWLYQLGEEQTSVLGSLQDLVEDALLSDDPGMRSYYILGGPGTGKTSVLLNLAKHVVDEGFTCRVHVTRELAKYVGASSSALDWKRVLKASFPGWDDADVVLVDDPPTPSAFPPASTRMAGACRVAVCAVDPLQLDRDKDVKDKKLYSRFNKASAPPFELGTCYRQKTNVGTVAKNVADVIASSTPYINEESRRSHTKERSALTEFANDLTFVNPLGYAERYLGYSDEDVEAELNRIVQSGRLWDHWPSLLIATDEKVKVQPIRSDISSRRVSLKDARKIKGVEFPHVFVFLKRSTYRSLTEGFTGSGRPQYDAFRLMRIPFSRARDSLVLFVR